MGQEVKDFTASWEGSCLPSAERKGYLGKCENPVYGSNISVYRTAMVSREGSTAVLVQEPLSWPLGTVPLGTAILRGQGQMSGSLLVLGWLQL